MITVRISKSKEMNGEQSLFVSFPYDNKIVSVIRAFSSRYWDKENKKWELPLKSLGKLTEKLSDYEFEITGFYQPEEKKAFSIPSNFKFKTQPFEHQIDGFQFGLENDRWLLGDEQGLGKTKQVIDIAVAKKLERGYKHCLIICGVNGLKWNWQNEIETHSDETGWILGQRLKAGKWKIGSNKDKLADLNTLESLNSYFLITNIETLRVAEISAKIAELCKGKTIGIVAIDEIHKCFDYDTLISTDLGELKIGDIVTNKIKCNVVSYNENTNDFEIKPITNYFENAIFDEMLELDIETSNEVKTIKCTKNHLFYTSNRGWVKADDLTFSDDIVEYCGKDFETTDSVHGKRKRFCNKSCSAYESKVLLQLGLLHFYFNYAIPTKLARDAFPEKRFPYNYKPDFVNLEDKLCIEIDGPNHLYTKEIDDKKDFCLNYLGFKVLRFTHEDIDEGRFDEWLNSYVKEKQN